MEPSLGELLKTWRVKRGLSLRTLAQEARISHTTLGRWEAGQFFPCLPELEATLDALHLPAKQRRRAVSQLQSPRAIRWIRREDAAQRDRMTGQRRPTGGDLLRALRRRSRRTQSEIAAALGVTTGTVSRWESGQSWPATQELQTLCCLLGAREKEFIVLTTERFAFAPLSEDISLDALAQRLEDIRWNTYECNDLGFLALEANLWEGHNTACPEARLLLARLWAYYADYLSSRDRFSEVAEYANRVWEMRSEVGRPERWHLSTALAEARASVYRGGRPNPRHGLETLQDWRADEAGYDPEYRAWMLADRAKYTTLLGDMETALTQGAAACRIAAHEAAEHELNMRRCDYGELLAQAGRPEEGLSYLPAPWTTPPEPERHSQSLP